VVRVTVCASCRWDNDTDSGPCAGCGQDLSGATPAVAPDAVPPTPAEEPTAAPGEDAGVLRPSSSAVPIRPMARATPTVVEPHRGVARSVDRARTPARAQPDRGPRTPAPVRDIPVVLGSPGARPAVRTRGEVRDGDASSFDEPTGGPLLPQQRGSTLCPGCGRSLPADRSFCRCGAQVSREPARSGESSPSSETQRMTRQAFTRAQRRAEGGRRPRYDQPLSARTWLARVLAVLLVVGALGSQSPPWGDDVRGWIGTRVEAVVP
jgi:hypothetical protein